MRFGGRGTSRCLFALQITGIILQCEIFGFMFREIKKTCG